MHGMVGASFNPQQTSNENTPVTYREKVNKFRTCCPSSRTAIEDGMRQASWHPKDFPSLS
jgi:hypothetical protein